VPGPKIIEDHADPNLLELGNHRGAEPGIVQDDAFRHLSCSGEGSIKIFSVPPCRRGECGFAWSIMISMPPEKAIRRIKTYAGAQGYVYQYYFVGKRPALREDPTAPATEFVFDVTSDRKLTYAVSVLLPEEAVKAWAAAHGRPLNDAEQYAAAKLRLFRAFDEFEDVKAHGRRLVINGALLEEFLASLGVG
jgi:hypothetical protein